MILFVFFAAHLPNVPLMSFFSIVSKNRFIFRGTLGVAAGLTLGNHLVGEFLPGYLATKFNADPEAVARKVAAVLDGHDWANFANTECGKTIVTH